MLIKKYTISSLILLMAVFLVACGDKSEEEGKTPAVETEENNIEITDDEKVPDKDVVAVINGEDITGQTYNLVYAQLKLFAGQMGEEVDTEEIKQATMDSLIDRTILMQHARDEGIEVTDKEAQKELETIKTENEEGLNSILEQYQMTEEGFQEQLKFELTLNEFKSKNIDVKVTDDEVKEMYEQAKKENEQIPELDEIKDTLKGNIEQQKENEAIQKKIDEMKEKAKIENKLEA